MTLTFRSGLTFGALATTVLAVGVVTATSLWLLFASGSLSIESFTVSLNFTFGDWWLVANISGIEGLFAKLDFEHGNNSSEGKVIKAFLKGLVFVKDSDVGDLVDLVEAGDAVLDEFSELDSGFDSVGDTLDNYAVGGVFSEEVVGALEVSTDTDLALDTDFVGREDLLRFFDTTILISHSVMSLWLS